MADVYLDSEFNDDLVLCFVVYCEGKREDFDTRKFAEVQRLSRWIDRHREDSFVAYSVTAEIESLLRLGIDPPRDWIDLMPETTQIVTTHADYRIVEVETDDGLVRVNPRTPGLLKAQELMTGYVERHADEKKANIELIISRSQWNAAEFRRILDYCADDARELAPLWEAVQFFHTSHSSPWKRSDAIYRGRTARNLAMLLHRSSGFPIDQRWLAAIYQHRVRIIHAEVDNAARFYRGYSLFTKTDDGAKENLSEIGRYADDNGLPWERSVARMTPILREEYLSGFCKECPSLRTFKECRDLIIQLRKNLWTEGDPKRHAKPLIRNGHVKAVSIPFYTKSGRSQPLVNRGHILNARPFIRTAITAPAGKIILGCDWSQQEIAIALHFFPDERLQDAYDSGDIYFSLAQMAGAIPDDVPLTEANKERYDLERQQFKSVQLGLGYGMGAASLGRKMFADLNGNSDSLVITRAEADERALEIFEWHKETFADYWEAVDEFIDDTTTVWGWCKSEDNWLYFADEDTPKTQLQNIRMQANGATMMHFALNALAKTKIDFLAEHHDAIYVMCDEADVKQTEEQMRQIMNRAAQAVIDVPVALKIKRYKQYTDKRADNMVALLNNHLQELEYVR